MTVSISPMTTIKNRCHQIDYRALAETGEISDDLYYFRLCCLLENAAKCANTASVYGAFFKHLKQSAQKTLVIAPADYQINNGEHEVYNEDANSLIKRIEGDILYLDPPYNSRQYSANYHLLNTIADYKSFTPKGKTELREYNKSNYCSKAKVQHTFKDLIRNARFRYIVLSYNNEGIMPMQTIEQIMAIIRCFKRSIRDSKQTRLKIKTTWPIPPQSTYRRNRIRNSRPTHKMRRDKIWKNTVSFGKQENKSDPHG